MAGAADDDEREKPLDPAVERVRGKLIRFMVINLGLLFVALMAVVIAIVYRSGNREAPPAAAVPELPAPAPGEALAGDIVLPEGARIAGHALSGNRISLDVLLKDGGRAIYIYDIATRSLVGRFDIAYKP